MRNLTITFISLFSFTASIKAQIDSSSLLYSAKLQIVSEGHLYDSSKWKAYLNEHTATFLKSAGFNHTYFILIERKDKDSLINNRIRPYIENQIFFICNYVVAYNTKTRLFYKLKGFIKPDINEFIGAINLYSKASTAAMFFSLGNKEANYLLRQKECYVEFLDIDCIRQVHQLKSTNEKKYPCLISCFSRDKGTYGK